MLINGGRQATALQVLVSSDSYFLSHQVFSIHHPLKSVRFNAARSVSLSRHMLELFLADNVLNEALGEVVAQLEDRVRT
jgi:hypothetical protein